MPTKTVRLHYRLLLLEFLRKNQDKAFTVKELSETLGIYQGSIRNNLYELEDRKVVKCKYLRTDINRQETMYFQIA